MCDEVGVYRGIERKALEGLTKGCTVLMIAFLWVTLIYKLTLNC